MLKKACYSRMAVGRMGFSNYAFDTMVITILVLISILMVYPMVFIISASISDPTLVNSGQVWLLPKGIQFDGYVKVFENSNVLTGYRNSLFYLVFGTTLNVYVTYTCAYALSRKDISGYKVLTFFIMFTMWFSGGMIPTFLIIKKVGLIDSPLCLVVLGLVNAYNFIICRTFIQNSVPFELQEAARIDGCTDFGICFRIVFPLSKPVIAVLVLYYALEHWNGYFNAMLYINDIDLQPLQIILRSILIETESSLNTMSGTVDVEQIKSLIMLKKTMQYALIVVASLPMLILYPFLQGFFEKGIMIGSIKG